MAIKYSTEVIRRTLGKSGTDSGADGLRGIFANGVIKFFTGAQPLTADSAATGTYLGSVSLGGNAFTPGTSTNGINFGAPVGATLAKSSSEDWKFKGAAAGTIGWFRFYANAADPDTAATTYPRIDGTVGITSGDLLSTNVTAAVNGLITIDTFTVTGE